MEKALKNKIEKALEKVYDPEIGVPITEMKLVDKIDIQNGDIIVDYHLSMPYCPPMFAIKIGQDIKKVVSSIEGVKSIKVNLRNHYLADQITELINKEE
ncbi:MAG: iron-sulfur cluster assembly protein [Nitrososphaeria archaeon]